MQYGIVILLNELRDGLMQLFIFFFVFAVLLKFPDAHNKRIIFLLALCREEDMIMSYNSSSVSLP